MRRPSGIPLTLAISAIVHAGLFGAASLYDPPAPPTAPAAATVIEVVPSRPAPEVAPVEVVMLPPDVLPPALPLRDPAAAPLGGGAPAVAMATRREPHGAELPDSDARASDARASDAPASDARASDAQASDARASDARASDAPASDARASEGPARDTATAPTSPPARNRYLDMRRPGPPRLDLGVGATHYDDLEHAPAGTDAQHEPAPSGTLAPAGGGTYTSDQGTFTAKIGKDGRVKLRDGRNLEVHLALPSAKDLGDMIQAWYYDPDKPVGTLPSERIKRTPQLDPDSGAVRLGNDSVVFSDDKSPHPGGGGATIPILAGGFDISDAFMRGRGVDPYAAKKLAFLDSTRDERVRIGTQYQRAQLAQVSQTVHKHLARAWAAPDLAARKQALFELWDDCAETGPAEVVAAAETARKLVIGFIRARLPAGSEHAYSTSELAALNRTKQSRARFAPYED